MRVFQFVPSKCTLLEKFWLYVADDAIAKLSVTFR